MSVGFVKESVRCVVVAVQIRESMNIMIYMADSLKR